MYSQEDFQNVVEQLKQKIAEGKVTCFKCHFPVGGEGIKQIDLINGRITYVCPNHLCENKNKTGFRSFKALDVTIPSIAPPSDLAGVAAPAPPRPEEVQWTSEEGLLNDPDVDDDDDEISSVDDHEHNFENPD